MTTHRWKPADELWTDVCACCGMKRAEPRRFQEKLYDFPGSLGFETVKAITPPAPFLFRRYPWSRYGVRLFLCGSPNEVDGYGCLLATDYIRAGRLPWSTSSILLPCPGGPIGDWIPLWLAHINRLCSVASSVPCPRCRAAAGSWCQTGTSRFVPGLHQQQVRAKGA